MPPEVDNDETDNRNIEQIFNTQAAEQVVLDTIPSPRKSHIETETKHKKSESVIPLTQF